MGKSFGTSISPWIVTIEALRPFFVENPIQNPAPLSYLHHSDPYTIDINLSVAIKRMLKFLLNYLFSYFYYKKKYFLAEGFNDDFVVTKTNFKHLYWTLKQQLAHHTINGCNVRAGDLMGSGTVSGFVS